MALSKDGLVALVRELLLQEADEILGQPDDTLPPSTFAPGKYSSFEDAVAPTVSLWEENRLNVARRLFEQYCILAERELKKLLRQLPTFASVLANARFVYSAKRQIADLGEIVTVKANGAKVRVRSYEHDAYRRSPRLKGPELLKAYGDPHQLELARLRRWASRQLKNAKGVDTQGAKVLRVFVYLTLRDVCDWERAHVETFGGAERLNACVTSSFGSANEPYDGFGDLAVDEL